MTIPPSPTKNHSFLQIGSQITLISCTITDATLTIDVTITESSKFFLTSINIEIYFHLNLCSQLI